MAAFATAGRPIAVREYMPWIVARKSAGDKGRCAITLRLQATGHPCKIAICDGTRDSAMRLATRVPRRCLIEPNVHISPPYTGQKSGANVRTGSEAAVPLLVALLRETVDIDSGSYNK